MGNQDTFIEVTNADIYEAVKLQTEKLEAIEKQVITTNGKVKNAKWIATTALTLSITIIFYLLKMS